MISYESINGGGAYPIKSKDFAIGFATLNNQTSSYLNFPEATSYYICPISFFCYNGTNDTIDKLLFTSDYDGNEYTHEQNILGDSPILIGFFNQGLGAPGYDPMNYTDNILVNWSNLGHTYTSKSLQIRVFYYISKKFF